jgi:DNA mismatch endonuclease (patch repair protein)
VTPRHPPTAPAAQVRARMQGTRRRDTGAELTIRRELHARGLRYFVDRAALAESRRRPDIVFPAQRLAVFVDGCFWHSCPVHGTAPKANGEWWRAKLEANRARDRSADAELEQAGWRVLRFWEHEDPQRVADVVEMAVRPPGSKPRRVTTDV